MVLFGDAAGMELTSRHQAAKIVVWQVVVTLISALGLIAVGQVHAWSGLAGGAIATLGNTLFMLRVFVPYRAQQPGKLVGAFYGAELQKIILITLLFAAAIVWLQPISPAALFGVFLLVQVLPVVMASSLS